jgi:HEAT repeat protein
MSWLDDPRWYVQRNMLSILGELPDVPSDFQGARFLQHAEAKVRREAVAASLRIPAQRTRAVCSALSDADERIVRVGLAAALESCPDAAVSLVVQKATTSESPDQRLTAIHVLGECGNAGALNALLRLAKPKRRSLLGLKAAPKGPEMVAAVKALRAYESDERAKRVLAAASKSRDPDVARAAKGEG